MEDIFGSLLAADDKHAAILVQDGLHGSANVTEDDGVDAGAGDGRGGAGGSGGQVQGVVLAFEAPRETTSRKGFTKCVYFVLKPEL